ncbi:exopolysaccharide biosynthesis protein [Hyphomonas oceanitis]|uniref:ExoD family protein n=1 Tax=Hyphomonas oceanitis SCH89 TaxID=1280953 RepID=A0A059G595_9PROT|nr:exopolysaccharide biosynthesis protein [Hyphomonas oceanitis]KDA01653.1 ExoD family protein [Hyphomonas oceanitis SCH89]
MHMPNASFAAERTLLQTLEAMAASAPEEGLTLRDIMDQLDESAFGAGLFFLALPCCIPFLYGVPQVVSLPMMALAGQMAAGRSQPWMPEKFGERKIDRKGLTQMARGGRKWLGWIETFTKPRFKVITGKRSERIIGAFLCLFSASILLPLPMTNTVPGFGVALASFGLINKDGILVILGLLLGLAWIFGLVVLGPVALLALIGAAKDTIMGLTPS